jgi:hypothetical protein
VSTSSAKPVTLNLGALAGNSVKLRWHEGEDSSGSSIGWYVDTVVISDAAVGATCASGGASPPPVAESARFTRAAGNMLSVTYDTATCSAQKVIILYNALGTWDGYSGCAQPDGGNNGATTLDSTDQENVWYNLVWTTGGTAGHPGFASSGARTWNVGALCGMNADDHGRTTCP